MPEDALPKRSSPGCRCSSGVNEDSVLCVESNDIARAGRCAADFIVGTGDPMPLPWLPNAFCPFLSVPMKLPTIASMRRAAQLHAAAQVAADDILVEQARAANGVVLGAAADEYASAHISEGPIPEMSVPMKLWNT